MDRALQQILPAIISVGSAALGYLYTPRPQISRPEVSEAKQKNGQTKKPKQTEKKEAKKEETKAKSTKQTGKRSSPESPTRHTPKTHPEEFEPVSKTKAKRSKKDQTVWEWDMFHDTHYEVYKDLTAYRKGRNREEIRANGTRYKAPEPIL